jgi:hypothetical protein
MQVVQQRISGAVDTATIVVPTPVPPAAPTPADGAASAQGRGSQPI